MIPVGLEAKEWAQIQQQLVNSVAADAYATVAYHSTGYHATGNGSSDETGNQSSQSASISTLSPDLVLQKAYLKASNTDSFDNLGYSVAISGGTIVVGAFFEGSNATGVNGDQANNDAIQSGAAYLFDIQYQLTTAAVGSGQGTVTLDPPGGVYAAGTVVMVTATANTHSSLSNWSGALSGAANLQTVTMEGNKLITATFTLNQYQLTTATTGSGQGTVTLDPPGGVYDAGTMVTVLATASDDSNFDSWSGALSGAANSQTVTIDGEKHVNATFTRDDNQEEHSLVLPFIKRATK